MIDILKSLMKNLLDSSNIIAENNNSFELESSKEIKLAFLENIIKTFNCYLISDDYSDYDDIHSSNDILYLDKKTNIEYLYYRLLDNGGWALIVSCHMIVDIKSIYSKKDFLWEEYPPNHTKLLKIFEKYDLEICIFSFWDDIKWYVASHP